MKIKNPTKGLIEYEPYEFQKELIQKLVYEDKKVILFSSRQMGTSTTLFYCIREKCLNQPNYKAILVTSNGYGASGFNNFPDNDHIKFRSKHKIEYNNGSEILFVPGTDLDGKNFNDYEVYFDLFEFVDMNLQIKLSTCFTNINSNARFYSFTGLHDVAQIGFETLKWNWNLHPDRDENWLNEQIKILGQNQVNKEIVVE